jgi:hypothetical protein
MTDGGMSEDSSAARMIVQAMITDTEIALLEARTVLAEQGGSESDYVDAVVGQIIHGVYRALLQLAERIDELERRLN